MKLSGKQVAAARELLGLTQKELAIACGLDWQTIHTFEANKVEPRRSSIEKIAAELERRGIEFTNGDGIGIRLNYAKAAEFARQAKAHDPTSGVGS
jgi:transcriptional regulator with XRE-family HTH domain